MMRIAGVQFDMAWEDRAANFARVQQLVSAARLEPGTLVALPEMFASGFSMDVEKIADGPAEETRLFLSELAIEHRLFVLGGIVTRSPEGRGRNQSALFDPEGRELFRYQKIQPFTLGGESSCYEAGSEVLTFDWNGICLAPFICYDLRFPELFRHVVRQGAELFVVIASWPDARDSHWVKLLQARAIENQAYVLGVNRCGADPKLRYSGRSMIVDPAGEVMVDAGSEEGVFQASIDPAQLREYRTRLPFLVDIRPELVSGNPG